MGTEEDAILLEDWKKQRESEGMMDEVESAGVEEEREREKGAKGWRYGPVSFTGVEIRGGCRFTSSPKPLHSFSISVSTFRPTSRRLDLQICCSCRTERAKVGLLSALTSSLRARTLSLTF